ncbi:MAG: carbon starvation protein A [Ruaniaceae bacterium]|nr:carbon starvation protein A [Ruaniaceae bacterium]
MADTSPATLPVYTAEEEKYIIRNKNGVPVGTKPHSHWNWWRILIWVAISLAGATGWTMLAIIRNEEVNTVWFVITAVATYAIAYRFYALYIQKKIMRPMDTNATPSERVNNGKDFDPTNRVVLYGHHFAAIAGAGPLVGPVLAAQMGFLPGTLWIILGVLVAGAVQDMLVLFFSMRRGGRSLGQMAIDEIGKVGGTIMTIGVFVMLMIVLAVLAMICVNALAESPWGVFSIAMTIPIAIGMGLWLRFVQPGAITPVSIAGFVLLIAAIFGGSWVNNHEVLHNVFLLSRETLVVFMVIYGFFAAVLPVWLLLTPRDYLSTFMKVGTIVILAIGIIIVQPLAQMPAITNFASNTDGPVFAGTLFPFLFITIACGAISGMHATVSSGTTPKMIQKETQVRMVGYGGMLMESFVAIMALAAAVSLNQGVYFSMNMSPAAMANIGGVSVTADAGTEDYYQQQAESAEAAVGALQVNPDGTPAEIQWFVEGADGEDVPVLGADAIRQLASDVGEPSVVSRTGGAPTLAVAIANIMHQLVGGKEMMAFWYHFAIMFEALFILSAVDAVTRVSRFQLGDAIGNIVPKFRDPGWRVGSWLTTGTVVLAWGSLLYMGVTDPRGGIQTLYPLFGIANQLIATMALLLCTVIVIRKGYGKYAWIPAAPFVWMLIVTFAASWQKIFSSDAALGYWTQWSNARAARAELVSGGGDADAIAIQGAIIRNTFIQGTMSILFVLVVIAVIFYAVLAIIEARKAGGKDISTEDPYRESNFFAPGSLIATPLEKKLVAEYAIVGDPELIPGTKHGGH